MNLPELFDCRGQSGRPTFGLTLIFVFLVTHNLFRLASAGAAASRYRSGFNYLFPFGMLFVHIKRLAEADASLDAVR